MYPKIGSGMLYLDGSGDYLSLSTAISVSASENFTLECWVRPGSTAFTMLASGSGNDQFEINRTTGEISWYINGTQVVLTSGAGLLNNSWQHIAYVRSGSSLCAIFLNGVSVGTGSNSGAFQIDRIGTYTDAPTLYNFNGYIDDLRITTGIARYTANFTPPGQLFRNTKEVKLTTGGYLLPVSTLNEVSVVCADDVPNPYRNDLVKRVFPQ
jgi:hypothetical protein